MPFIIRMMTGVDSAVSIIVPVYREGPNIEPLVRRSFAALHDARVEAEMILVDDDSGDQTVQIVERLASQFPVHITVRTGRRGLSSAVLHGFARAANDVLVVMDADLQHPPEAIPNLVRPIAAGQADIVFGSRYAPGGAIAGDWPILRRLGSRVATLLARPLVPVKDPMSGFFALHRDTWLRAAELNPMGYKIGLELAVKARCRRCLEVPITFSVRQAGTSKLTIRQQAQYLRQLVHLYWYRYRS